MGACRRILTFCAVALIAAGTLSTASLAGATAAGSRHDVDSTGAVRATVTDIREILNQRSDQVDIFNRENSASFTIQANSRWAGSLWVPWAGNTTEAKAKCI